MKDRDIEAEINELDQHDVSRRTLIGGAVAVGLGITALSAVGQHSMPDAAHFAEKIKKEKIRRALLAGPTSVTSEATVAEMDREGRMTILRPGSND